MFERVELKVRIMKLDRSKFEQKSRPSQWLVSFRGPKEIERSSFVVVVVVRPFVQL